MGPGWICAGFDCEVQQCELDSTPAEIPPDHRPLLARTTCHWWIPKLPIPGLISTPMSHIAQWQAPFDGYYDIRERPCVEIRGDVPEDEEGVGVKFSIRRRTVGRRYRATLTDGL